MGNRTSLVNGSKTGVIVNMRQRNLTSVCVTDFLRQNHFNKNHTCTFEFHSPGSSQIMMNVSKQFDLKQKTKNNRSFYCLSTLRIHVYINIFNYFILQYIIYIYIYPRWLEILIDKADKENWLPLQPLIETQEKNRERHII